MKTRPCSEDDWAMRIREFPYLGLSPDSPLFMAVPTMTSDHHWDVQIHEGFEVGIVLEGDFIMEFKDSVRSLQPGDVWLCAPWEPHAHPITQSQPVLAIVVFLASFLGDERFGNISWEEMFMALPMNRPSVTTPEMRQAVLTIGQGLSQEHLQQLPDWSTAVRLFIILLLFFLSRGWTPPSRPTQPYFEKDAMHRLIPALNLVRSDPTRHTTITEVAQACAMSKTTFCTLFRKYVGMSFAEYRLSYRLSHAATLLITSSESIETIAAQAGFSDDCHLHHTFLKQYGCTPGKYRTLYGGSK